MKQFSAPDLCRKSAVMTGDATSLIRSISAAPDDAVRARFLRDAARDLLADPVAIAGIADVAIDAAAGEAMHAAAALLPHALHEARMTAENGAPEGAALMDALAAAITARDAARPSLPVLRLRLAGIYARADR